MNGEFLRNHWSYLVGTVIRNTLALGLTVLIIISTSEDTTPGFVWAVGIIIFSVAMSVLIWLRTKYNFLEDEIVVTRNIVSRREVRIQYDRLASVNIERDFIYRILGATKLSFNLNSSVNVNRAEAFIVLEKEDAEELRDRVYARMYGTSPASTDDEPDAEKHMAKDYDSMESLVQVTGMDIFLHSFLGMRTWQFAFGIVMLIYSVVSLVESGSVNLLAVILFAVEFFIPALSHFFRYYNYRIVRDGDTVVISSGLFSTRQDSFKLSKVNYVKLEEPLICRLMGRAILEAEVVGTADQKGMPLLCPLKDKAVCTDLIGTLLPEFECRGETSKQSVSALFGIVPYMAVSLAVLAAIYVLLEDEFSGLYRVLFDGVIVLLAAGILGWGHLAFRIRTFAMDDTIALIVTGAFDRVSNYVLLDKVQFVDVTTSPAQRRYGTARCTMNMLSTTGNSKIRSGVFDSGSLESLSYEVRDRIIDGRYDFRRFQ